MCCDWLFNLQIPESTSRVVVLRPASKTFINGMASVYEEDYDQDFLADFMTMHEFSSMMEKLNDSFSTQFPCAFCWAMGYICCPFTLGISLLCPYQCIKDAEETCRNSILRQNRQWLRDRGLEMALVRKRGTSWIEIRLPEKNELFNGKTTP